MSDASTAGQDPRWVLLTHLVTERAKAACNAFQSKREDVARVNEGMEAAFRVAIGHTIRAFYGVEAAAAYGRDGILPPDDADVAGAATPGPDDGLRKQYAAAIRAELLWTHADDVATSLVVADAVLAVRDRHVEQLAARVAELEKQVAEDAEDYHALADHTDATCEAVQRRDAAEAALAAVREYVETSDDDGIRTRETVLRILGDRAEGQPEHVYLSTGCRHGDHDYCQGKTGLVGPKIPAVCKFCKSPCICPCHRDAS